MTPEEHRNETEINEALGCNAFGRLDYARSLLTVGDIAGAACELRALLEYMDPDYDTDTFYIGNEPEE